MIASQLRVMTIDEGDGKEVPPGATVTIHFITKLINGLVVYSSYDHGPMEFK
jgi:FKBP-type peptidyl-prolyl cis-trans isomerase